VRSKTTKQGCLWGCGLLTLVLVAIAGTGTWYAAQMSKDFKAVQESEEELVREVPDDAAFMPGLVVPPQSDRLRAFAAVRTGLHERRLQLEQQVGAFQAEVGEGAGPAGFLRRLRAGTELAPVYAGYWQKRNTLLRAEGLGPREYDFLYRLIYYAALGHDPADGSGTPSGMSPSGNESIPAGGRNLPEIPVWAGDPEVLAAALAPYLDALEAAYSPVLNPLEIMFQEE